MDYIERQASRGHPIDLGNNHQYVLFIPHSRKASFFKESELILQFDMDQKINDAVTSQHTHDFKIVKILFEQQASTLSAEQIISFRTRDSAGRDSLYNFK